VKLISVALHGYKRFEERSSMNVDGKLVAVVGPNESGKSSFINALYRLNDGNPLATSGGSRETTRNVDIPATRSIIEATYLLEDTDQEALSDIPRGREARWFTLGKRAEGGTFWCTVEPRPRRDLRLRQRMVRTLTDTLSRRGFQNLAESEETDLPSQMDSLASTLNTEEDPIPEESLQEIENLASTLEDAVSDDAPKYLRQLPEQLRNLAEHEGGGDLHLRAIDALVEILSNVVDWTP
jgi:predicted ATP-dependent endonuclease of OLD family